MVVKIQQKQTELSTMLMLAPPHAAIEIKGTNFTTEENVTLVKKCS